MNNDIHDTKSYPPAITEAGLVGHGVSRHVLVTGSTGYIGSALVRRLARADSGFCVVAGSRREAVPAADVATLNLGDLASESMIRPSALASFDSIVHTAAIAHGRTSGYAELQRVNTEAALKLATAAADAGVRRFIFLSTAGVMGPTTTGRPVTERDPPRPVGHYATSKLEAERGLWKISDRSKMEVVIVRPPAVYGVGAPGTLRRLSAALQKGVPLPLAGIHNRRSFVAIDNLIDFLSLCLEHPIAAGRTFFVSDGPAVSTTDFVRWLAMTVRSRSPLFFVPELFARSVSRLVGSYRLYQSLWRDFHVDDTEARQRLGWQPDPRSADVVCDLRPASSE